MSGRIFLIVEDENDGKVVREILHKRGIFIEIQIRPPTGGKGGISRLANQLSRLIATAKAERRSNDCIAVLHDRDAHTQPKREHYERIAQLCRQEIVKEIIACDELEAWMLADSGICNLLKLRPRNWDEQRKPKKELESRLRTKKLTYEGKDHAKVISYLNGDGDQRSPSMRDALAHLEDAPCARP